jgi:hypothetical protein
MYTHSTPVINTPEKKYLSYLTFAVSSFDLEGEIL